MRVTTRTAATLATCALAASLAPMAATAVPAGGPTAGGEVRQIGTYGFLDSPDYSGLAPLRSVVRPGSIGLGTFRRIDGELVVMDGTAYRVGTSGDPEPVSTGRRTPFAQAVVFDPMVQRRLPAGTECADLVPMVDDLVDTTRGMVAVRLTGRFRQLTTRSVPAQRRPWPSLSDVVAQQVEFDLSGRRADLVGFRTGPDLTGASPVGIHLHGLTRNRAAGGHVLSCTTASGVRLQAQPDLDLRVLAP